jgi:hypothetical protein
MACKRLVKNNKNQINKQEKQEIMNFCNDSLISIIYAQLLEYPGSGYGCGIFLNP